jgi:tetratricopeptide (TPR) repeat protein
MSKNIFHISFFLLWVSLALTSSAIAQDADLYMQQGVKKYQNGDYKGALEKFKAVARVNPDHPEVYEYAGNAYFILEKYSLAEKVYTIALEKKYQQNLNSGSPNAYRQGSITILSPNNQGSSARDYAMIYNNRGAVRLFRGDTQGAKRDFKEALKLDSELAIAQQNLQKLQSGNYQSGSNNNGEFVTEFGGNKRINRGQNIQENQEPNYLGIRPGNINKTGNIRQQKQDAIEFRENRKKSQSDDSNFFTDIFKSKDFERRRVPRKGKLYKAPPVGASSRNYITIESVRITQSSTYVNFKVVNRRNDTYYLSLAPKDIEEYSFMITDRQGNKDRTFRMSDVSGIEVYPSSSRLDPQTAILFTIEFPKIPDTMGYINIVEGSKQNGNEWNFYNVDLTQ